MKKLLISLIMGSVFMVSPTIADDSLCPMIGTLAKTAMEKRQSNILMSELISAIERSSSPSDPYTVIVRTMIIQAYNIPLYVTEEAKARAINEFANANMAACYAA